MTPLVADVYRARLETGFARLHTTWMQLLGAQQNNSQGVLIERFGERIMATAATAVPSVQWMQHVIGVTPDDAHLVPAIVAWYQAHGVRPRFEVAVAQGFEPLSAALTACGFSQTGFTDVLFGRPDPAAVGDVEVRQAENPMTFGRILLEGHGAPFDEGSPDQLAAASFPAQPGYRCYVAWIDGEPVGQAILVVRDGVGYLANASVLPSGRGRGAQTALIRRRIADAAAGGCEIVATMAVPGGSSHRNLERAGFQVAYGKAIWTML